VADDDDRAPRTGLWILLGLLLIALLVAGWFLVKDSLFPASPEEVQVPMVTGLTEDQARAEIGDAGLEVGEVTAQNDDTVPAGRVIAQDPAAEDFVDPDTAVDLVVSAGKPQVEVPSVVGLPRRQAAADLRDRGFKVVAQVKDTDDDPNEVLEQRPLAGTQAAEGSTVTIVYSDGPEEVPDVVGLTEQEAERRILRAGFEPSFRDDTTSTEPNGTVTDQIPGPGETADQGSTVTVFVSRFVEPTTTTTPPTTSPTSPPTEPTVPPPTEPGAAVTPRRTPADDVATSGSASPS
jgi:serine/threonine-protein kinase